ncbi:IclR family transcriptional regulator [Bacilli bacterium]|uniref:IclR family transcriptional regulator n=2 Tax=Oceanobacillus caeni TaxID=405946 RepID=UPI000A07C7A9|nr:IclR family transcriptional regulator [Bacilli bacterium]PZD89131.1 IclR family transcriptional regulator [Bacilli bacterium]PZD91704.1 IclR family transcriptional regulator [Bacilli bacterium]RCO06153.1 IclR family transcriptional regulator [Bacilli bacterium]RCO08991.1 IclR family transcriptional regulator [Bacilli bacterium]
MGEERNEVIRMSQSLVKAIKILDCFSTKAELSLIELVELSGLPKTTVFRLLSSLEETGLVVKVKNTSHDVKFRLGLKLLEYGNYVNEQIEYRKIALPHMMELNETLNELVHLTVVEKEEAVYVEKIDSTKPVRLVIEKGRRSPLYAGSAPKLLLAAMDDAVIDSYLEKVTIKQITKNTIRNVAELKEEIRKIREQGYSFSRSEHFKNTMGFSFPIYDRNGNTIAAIGVSISSNDYSEERGKVIIEKTRKAARNIWKDMGWDPDSCPSKLIFGNR